MSGGGKTEARDGLTVANTLESGPTSLFASYSRTRLTIDAVNPLFDAFRQFGPEGEAVADRYDVDGKRFEIISIGARYDPGDWFVMGEWSRAESRTFIGDSRSWDVSAGYRFGTVTPYVTLARTRATSNTSDPGLQNPDPGAQELNATLNTFLGSAAEQKSVSVGARWDYARNFALKVQYDRLDLDDGSRGG